MLVILLNNLVNNAIVSLALVSLVLYVTGEIIYSGIKDSCCDTDISTVLLRGPPDPVLS